MFQIFSHHFYKEVSQNILYAPQIYGKIDGNAIATLGALDLFKTPKMKQGKGKRINVETTNFRSLWTQQSTR